MMEDIEGRVVPCPECATRTGVPLPVGGAVVETAVEADDSVITRCPECDAGFDVHYVRTNDE